MHAIFISYRRDDSEGETGRLFDDLVVRFGSQKVFMDVAGLEIGRDFRKGLDQSVAGCGVLLAVIGPNWITAKDEAGHARLENPMDFVRLEVASALQRDIPVVPVLVRGAKMPHPEQLPEGLKELAYRNGMELTHARWSSDLKLLIEALERILSPAGPPRVAWWRRRVGWVAAFCGVAVVGLVLVLHHPSGAAGSDAERTTPINATPQAMKPEGTGPASEQLAPAKIVDPLAVATAAIATYGSKTNRGSATPQVTPADGNGFRAEGVDGYTIYYTEATGVHSVHGAIRFAWLNLGGPKSWLGYPISDEEPEGGGFVQSFSNGTITWTEEGGPVPHRAP